jgi:hypothetical protein
MKNDSLIPIRQLFNGLTVTFLIGCGNVSSGNRNITKNMELENSKTEETKPSVPDDYSLFDYTLPQSNYTYKIKIIYIETEISKEAFTTKADEYSIPKKVDGYFLTIKFAITNPYDKEMMAPVPDYYYITSANGEWFSSSTTNHRKCHCQINNSSKVTDLNGKELWQTSEGRCGYDDYCFKFSPYETKEFKISFKDPLFGEVKKIAFNGFGLKWNNPSYTREQDKGLLIDIENKKIIGEKHF